MDIPMSVFEFQVYAHTFLGLVITVLRRAFLRTLVSK